MKRILSLAVISAFIASAFAARGYGSSDLPNYIFKFSPQHMIRNGMWLSGEFFNDRHSTSHNIGIEAMYSEATGRTSGVLKSSGFTAEYMFRYYPGRLHVQQTLNKEYVKGFYVGFFGQAGSYNLTTSNYYSSSSGNYKTNVRSAVYYPGFILGMQQALGESIYLDLYIGAGMHISNIGQVTSPVSDYNISNYYFIYTNGILPKVGLSLGVGF